MIYQEIFSARLQRFCQWSKLMIWRVKLNLFHCLLIEPRGSICCPSILSKHPLFPLLISKASSSPITSVRLCLDFCARSATFSKCYLRRCLAFRIRGATCIPSPRSRDFFLSFGDHNLSSGIFSCNTWNFSSFGVFFLVSVFLVSVSEDFTVSPKNDFGRFPVISFLSKSWASYDQRFELFFNCWKLVKN